MGKVIQGSMVEFSLACRTGQGAKPMPASLGSLPVTFRRPLEGAFTRFQAAAAKTGWRLQVHAPSFVVLDGSQVDYHSASGVMAVIWGHIDTARVGAWNGQIIANIWNRSHGTNSISIPISAEVRPKPTGTPRRILICESPYRLDSTSQGADFAPMVSILSRLAEDGILIDVMRDPPADLTRYQLILMAGSTLASPPKGLEARWREHLLAGRHLVFAADAFFCGTSQTADSFLRPWGLIMSHRDAGLEVSNVVVESDALTKEAHHVSFWRPAMIAVTDPSQGKLLVRSTDYDGGFVAVSRKDGRGEVRVLAQSLWWYWVGNHTNEPDCARLLEALLRP